LQLPDLFPLCRGHTAPVLDTAWSPFDDSLVASVGEDSALALTRVDDQLLHDAWSHDRKEHLPDIEPLWRQSAHGRKAGHVKFHPTAEGILATASNDVKIWDVNAQKSVLQSETHADMVQSFDWDWTGSTYATTCKDKKLRLFDPRSGAKAVTVADSHTGVKSSRVCWLGSLDRIVTTGFSRTSDRQTFLWDSRDLTKGPIKQMTIDQSSGMLMPFFVAGNKCVFRTRRSWSSGGALTPPSPFAASSSLLARGEASCCPAERSSSDFSFFVLYRDGNVRMYELADDELFYLSVFFLSPGSNPMAFLFSDKVFRA
jgi:coronin-1B/1C/6